MRWLPQILCLLVLTACAHAAHAQSQPVYRCLGAQGEPVFSGQPCGTPAPPTSSGAAVQGSGTGSTCAASPQALRQSIAEAFTTHDVNRLAGLILWQGIDPTTARSALQTLAGWLKQPLAGIAIAYAAGPPRASDSMPSATPVPGPAAAASVGARPPSGFEVSTGGGDGDRRDFGVVQTGGCWWLTF